LPSFVQQLTHRCILHRPTNIHTPGCKIHRGVTIQQGKKHRRVYFALCIWHRRVDTQYTSLHKQNPDCSLFYPIQILWVYPPQYMQYIGYICIWLSISLSITACHIYSLNLFIVSFLPSHSPTTPVLRIESRVSTKIHFSIFSKFENFSKIGKFLKNFVFAIIFFFSKKFRIFFIFAQSFAKMSGVFAKNCQTIFREKAKTKMFVETLIERYWWAGCKQTLPACLLKLVQ